LLWLVPGGEWERGGVVWRNETGEEGACWLYSPRALLGELGQRGGREVGVQPQHWLGVAVLTRPTAWAVVLDACRCRLARACLRQNDTLQVFDR
jgi:hypothetical protein